MTRRFALLLTAAALLTACSSGAQDNAAPESGQPQTELHASRLKDYQSVAELQAASTAVVRATVETSTVEKVNGVPLTITVVRVKRTLWGEVPSGTLAIQQIGDSSMLLHDTGKILGRGREYVLFVTPFHLTPGDNTGRYLITGDQGAFALDSEKKMFVFAGGGEPAQLPRTLQVEEVDSASFLR